MAVVPTLLFAAAILGSHPLPGYPLTLSPVWAVACGQIVDIDPAVDVKTAMVNHHIQRLLRADERYAALVKDWDELVREWNVLIRQENTIVDISYPRVISLRKAQLSADWRKLAKRMRNIGDAKRNVMRDLAKALEALAGKP